jgi:hypothetical protein
MRRTSARPDLAQGALDALEEVHGGALDDELVLGDAGYIEQVLQEPGHVLGAVEDDLAPEDGIGGVGGAGAVEDEGRVEDRGERVA